MTTTRRRTRRQQVAPAQQERTPHTTTAGASSSSQRPRGNAGGPKGRATHRNKEVLPLDAQGEVLRRDGTVVAPVGDLLQRCEEGGKGTRTGAELVRGCCRVFRRLGRQVKWCVLWEEWKMQALYRAQQRAECRPSRRAAGRRRRCLRQWPSQQLPAREDGILGTSIQQPARWRTQDTVAERNEESQGPLACRKDTRGASCEAAVAESAAPCAAAAVPEESAGATRETAPASRSSAVAEAESSATSTIFEPWTWRGPHVCFISLCAAFPTDS